MPLFIIAKKVLSSLFRKPATEKYPFGEKTFFSNTRGSVAIDISQCIFCGLCQKKCPTKALLVERGTKKWDIDLLRCITCGYCVESCPKKCLRMESQYTKPIVPEEEFHKNIQQLIS